MIHIIEEDSHSFPPHFRSPRHIAMTTGKRARSPENGSSGDRPSKRLSLAVTDVNRHTILRRMSSTPNSSRHPSEDWVQQAGGLRINSPVYPPSEPFVTPPPEDVDMEMDSEDLASSNENGSIVEIEDLVPTQVPTSSHFSRPHSPDMEQTQQGSPSTPRHNYPTRYSERMQASAPTIPPHINVLPPTPMNTQQYLQGPSQPHDGVDLPGVQNSGFVFPAPRPSTSPPISPVPMAISPTSSFSQVAPSSPKTTKRRVVFGPRANCEKCRLGEKHFIHYE